MKTKQHAQFKRGLKLEVGKLYHLRSGGTARVERKTKNDPYPFEGVMTSPSGEVGAGSWRVSGGYLYSGISDFDIMAPVTRKEVQGTFLNVWQLRTGKLQVSIHTGKKAADAAQKVGAKRVGQVRHSRRKGLEVVS